ncbi:MAG TPA: diadenylate cyclase [Candidatus Thermoplasmatota archaeon]|nr:diadenylate cyclase [Candidatus Thermoplasmatota archaeon]
MASGRGPDKGRILIEHVSELGDKLGVNLLFVMSDNAELLHLAVKSSEIPVIIATSDPLVEEEFAPLVRNVMLLTDPLSGSLATLGEIKDLLLGAFLRGNLTADDHVLCLASNLDAVDIVVYFDVAKDLELTHLREELKGRVNMEVVERVLRLAAELAREGREGKPIGTVFIIGDTENVLMHSRQIVINPFRGHPEPDRDILNDGVWETTKEFAQIDGAFVIREDGIVEAAGRYVDTDRKVELTSGLGGRHLAAASITKLTRAVAVTVSTSGAIRVFKDGRVVMMVGSL